MPNTPNIRSNGRRDPNRHGLRRHMANPYDNNGYRNGRNAIPSNGYVAPIGPGSRPGMRRKPGFYGGGTGGNINNDVRSWQIWLDNQNQNDLMSVKDCASCSSSIGSALAGTSGVDWGACNNCRTHVHSM